VCHDDDDDDDDDARTVFRLSSNDILLFALPGSAAGAGGKGTLWRCRTLRVGSAFELEYHGVYLSAQNRRHGVSIVIQIEHELAALAGGLRQGK